MFNFFFFLITRNFFSNFRVFFNGCHGSLIFGNLKSQQKKKKNIFNRKMCILHNRFCPRHVCWLSVWFWFFFYVRLMFFTVNSTAILGTRKIFQKHASVYPKYFRVKRPSSSNTSQNHSQDSQFKYTQHDKRLLSIIFRKGFKNFISNVFSNWWFVKMFMWKNWIFHLGFNVWKNCHSYSITEWHYWNKTLLSE